MERRTSGWIKLRVNIIDYTSHEFLKSCFMVEAKMIKPNVLLDVYRGNS